MTHNKGVAVGTTSPLKRLGMINQDFPAAVAPPVGFTSCGFNFDDNHALLSHITFKHGRKETCSVLAPSPRSTESGEALLVALREV